MLNLDLSTDANTGVFSLKSKNRMAYNVYPDEMTHYEPPLQDLHVTIQNRLF